ncbi:MAG TPA: hypothetical protein VEK11_08500 [Thermoanaerobaculia bacterium]|nr:hypothetical protein [Thermoanaerobaculia bacterium]
MTRRFLLVLAAMTWFVPSLLLLDGPGVPRQLALGATTIAVLWLCMRTSPVPAAQILCAIAVATLGEVVLSVGWGLYDYAHALIPLYVPPGHGLFYALAAESATQPFLRKHERIIVSTVLIAVSAIAIVTLFALGDTWGFLWWLGVLALIARSENRLLLATCVVYTLLLEYTGTAMGNWTWAAEVPGVGLRSANPPSGVGILYVVLDLIVVAIALRASGVRVLWTRRPLPEA